MTKKKKITFYADENTVEELARLEESFGVNTTTAVLRICVGQYRATDDAFQKVIGERNVLQAKYDSLLRACKQRRDAQQIIHGHINLDARK